MTLATIAWIYALGWFSYAAYFAIKMYRSGDMKGMEAKIIEKAQDPEVIAHYENNVHGIRTKMRIFLPAFPLVLAFMLGSVWWLVLAIRISIEISRLIRRDRD